jgi:ABC-2 type transport system permease protein
MSAFTTIARQEVLALRREKLPGIMLGIFIALVTVSSFIGFLTKNTVSDVWLKVSQAGLTQVANPFESVSPLYYARNAVIYIILIGTLMAIVAGVTSGIRDRKAATVDLVLTRPATLRDLVFGKLAGLGIWLTIVVGIVAVIASALITVIAGNLLNVDDYLRLLAFFTLSLPLLMGFAGIGLLSGLLSARESSSLLGPIGIWAMLTFVAPQLGTAARPVSLLNPVPVPATSGGGFDFLNLATSPFSVSEKFKLASGLILKDPDISGNLTLAAVNVVLFMVVVGALLLLVNRTRIRGVASE